MKNPLIVFIFLPVYIINKLQFSVTAGSHDFKRNKYNFGALIEGWYLELRQYWG